MNKERDTLSIDEALERAHRAVQGAAIALLTLAQAIKQAESEQRDKISPSSTEN